VFDLPSSDISIFPFNEKYIKKGGMGVSEDRRQKTEDRRQKTEDRRQSM